MLRYSRPRRRMPFPAASPTLAIVREARVEYAEVGPGIENVAPSDAADSPDHPDLEADALEDLGDEIATLAAHIHAATQRFLALIADFDGRCGWEMGGHRSCAHWLSFRTGIDLGACREKVRTARVLAGLPETSAAMARGELSFSAVRALSRVATPDNEEDLLTLATGCTITQLERLVRGWKRFTRTEEVDVERERHESRYFSVFPDDDGMYVVKGRLPAEVGALLMQAMDAAGDALYREHPTGGEGSDTKRRQRAAQRRADTVALLAERAMSVGFGEGEVSEAPGSTDGPENGAFPRPSTPISGTHAERYQVILHVDKDTLAAAGEPGRSHLEDGTRVSAETSRRLSCDAGRVVMTHDEGGLQSRAAGRGLGTQVGPGTCGAATEPSLNSILNVGRKTRTIPLALRRALDFRDRGCRFPGCGLRFTDAHHIKHWADGGETSLDNCLLLCSHHHRLLHEGGWQVTWWGEGNPCFVDPRGGTHFDGRWDPPVLPPRPVEAMIETTLLQREGSGEGTSGAPSPDGFTAGARWKREAHIPDDVYFRALEAIG